MVGHISDAGLTFLLTAKQFSKMVVPFYIRGAECESPSSATSLPAEGMDSPSGCNYLRRHVLVSGCGFNLTYFSLRITDAEHSFMGHLYIFSDMSVQRLSPLFIYLFIYLFIVFLGPHP